MPKDWEQFQHYKDRRPPWIKIHRSLLDDRAYMALPVEARALAPLLWLLASENSPPSVEASDVAWRLRLPEQEVQVALQALVASGFVTVEASCKHDASAVLAECLHVATPERERDKITEEIRGTDTATPSLEFESVEPRAPRTRSEPLRGFDAFWDAYGKKVGLRASQAAWKRIQPDDALAAEITAKAAAVAAAKEKQFRKDPERWLKGRHWEDEIVEPSRSAHARTGKVTDCLWDGSTGNLDFYRGPGNESVWGDERDD